MGINLPETKSEAESFCNALGFSDKNKPDEVRLKPLVKTNSSEWNNYIDNQIVPSHNINNKDDFTSVYDPQKKSLAVDFKVKEIDSSVADSLVFSIKELLTRHELITKIINVINGLDGFIGAESKYQYNLIEGTIIYDIEKDDRKIFVTWHSFDLTRINVEITPNDNNGFDLFTIDSNPTPTIMRRDAIDPILVEISDALGKIICK